ncbi:uncharacterized protein LOC132709560 [Pantherophis guttatus]|uniref:Uncharacterized protein LOC132709449 n=1 Tax=Pantherophis guttatus TaxID=94885 RepID=A0ABM3YU41_PANGU|nr:uncharacterized protein LOC132709449 [Pantherophis guttatus]XP_060539631.1 uncharacterized protein LOC132709560 [Pantherophis guttatus]
MGLMVLQEIESQDIQAGIRGLESYDNVPEEDDITISSLGAKPGFYELICPEGEIQSFHMPLTAECPVLQIPMEPAPTGTSAPERAKCRDQLGHVTSVVGHGKDSQVGKAQSSAGHRDSVVWASEQAKEPESSWAAGMTLGSSQAWPERGPKRITHVLQEAPQIPEFFAHLTETRGIPDERDQFPEPYDTEDEGEDDPMVSGPVHPFLFPIRLTAPKTGAQETFQALIDSGSTRCLINLPTVLKLGIRAKQLKQPIRFEQVDGSLVGGTYATHLTEPVRLELADHWETIRFIIAPKMTEPVILGLSWLDKWGPIIWWQEGTRRLRIAKGPQPLPPRPEEFPPTLKPQSSPPLQKKTPPTQGPLPEGAAKQLAAAPTTTCNANQIPREYQDLAGVFSEAECDILPPHRETDCAIEIIPGAKLPKPKMYAMTPREMQEMRDYIDKNLQRGFIEPVKPRVAAPVMFKEKKDGSMRLVVDFRSINAVCVHNLYPLPLMKDMLAHLAKGKVFTKLDLREAYYRVRIRAGDEWKTAFNCPLGSFQFKVMPFGLQGAPAVFMQLINEVLHEHLYKGVLVYLDDILIYTETIDEHIPLVRQVLEKLLRANLYVKLPKCDFHQSRLDYLGYRVSNEGIEMDPAKVQSVLQWQPPRTRRQLQSFLGFANFYRQFIPSFAEIAKPLTDLLKTGSPAMKPRPGQPLQWDLTCQQAFETLKGLFAKEPVLKHPDPEQPFVIQADASDVAVGAVLLQKNNQGDLQPCAYTSRKLTDTERRWAAWEKEAFAVRWALLTWRHLLEGGQKPFEVWTDHKNLEALKTPRKLSPRQVRWAQYFNRFNFELKHIPGGRNFLADALSRMPQYNSEREQVVNAIIPSTQAAAQVITRRQRRDQQGQLASDLTAKLKNETLTDPWYRDNQHLLTKRDELMDTQNGPQKPEILEQSQE